MTTQPTLTPGVSTALTSSIDPSVPFGFQTLPLNRAFGINDAGLVVGDIGGNNIASYWTATGGLIVRGRLDGATSCCSTFNSVNANSEATGWSNTAYGVGVSLLSFPANSYSDVFGTGASRGMAINDAGNIAGHHDGGTPFFKPFGQPALILSRAPFGIGFVNDMNNSNSIVGILGAATGYRAVAWSSPSQPVIDLGTLGGNQSWAVGINDAGDIVGWSEIIPGNSARRAVLWPAGGGRIDLSTWANHCAGNSEASDVNNNGVIIGRCGGKPVIWTAVQGMRELPLPAGQVFGDPQGINDRNEIVGMINSNSFGGAMWKPLNTAPIANPGGPYATAEGIAVPFDGTGSSDADGDALTYVWDFGDGNGGTGASPGHVYVNDGEFTVTLTVIDSKNAASAPVTTTVSVANAPPTAQFVTTGPVAEGSVFALALNDAADASPDDQAAGFEFAFDCGDGYQPYGSSASFTCPTTDNGAVAVRAQLRDRDGGEREYHGVVHITNVAPALGSLALPADPQALLPGGTTIALAATFSDPGTGDTHIGAIDCGGGTASAVSSSASNGAGTLTGSCTFTLAGVYSVSVTVTDDDGGTDTEFGQQFIVVYDPSAGFVTGGGWIASPAGAYVADPAMTGKATFGFVSRYKKGADVPSGNTEFHFETGQFKFSSTAYDWLVVAGAKAQFKGTGTVNGLGGFGFLLTATDGQIAGGADRFRIKIWNIALGEVVYDNVAGGADDLTVDAQVLSGGSITIHR